MDVNTGAKPQSLADLVAQGTDDVAVLTSRLPAEGIFIVRGESVKREVLNPKTPEQDEMLKIGIMLEILNAQPLDKTIDPTTLVGKKIADTRLMTAETYKERMGLLKGDYKKVGLPYNGEMGGLAEVKGWLDGVITFPFQVRVRHVTAKNGSQQAYLDWSRMEPKIEAEVFAQLGIPVPAREGPVGKAA